jgi:type I restriction enzyme S subunit
MEKQVNIPKLRFPEFSGWWENNKLGDVGSFFSGGTPLTSKRAYFDGVIPFIRSGEINSDKTEQFISDEGLKKSSAKMVEKGDLIYALYGATSGEVGISKINGAINQAILCIRTNHNTIYLMNYLRFNKDNIINTYLQGGQGNLSAEIIKSLIIPFPSLPEQQKIASFLTAVDDKLQALKKKKSLLEQYKKGIMQKIFSQELRFRDDDGNDFPEWEEKKFSRYIKLYRGSSPRPINKYITKSDDGVNWIKIGDMKSVENNLIDQVSEKITTEGALHSRKVEIGELILANSMSFGKTYQLNISGCIYDGWFVLREYEKYYDKKFLMQLLNSEYLQKQYKTLSTGGVVQNISSEIVYSTNLFKPSLTEQSKIANFLSALDEKIHLAQGQIEKMEVWKKGLLQKMFV